MHAPIRNVSPADRPIVRSAGVPACGLQGRLASAWLACSETLTELAGGDATRVRPRCHDSKSIPCGCPGGTSENSPAFQRWVWTPKDISPGGTADSPPIQPSLRDLVRPNLFPSVETLGYSHPSLWDEQDQILVALGGDAPTDPDPLQVQAQGADYQSSISRPMDQGLLAQPNFLKLVVTGFLALVCTIHPVQAQSLLLKGAVVHTVSGTTLSPGQVLIQDGKIAAVGETVPANGAAAIDLTGQHLYPGIILLDSVLGLTEIEAVRATDDASEVGEYTPDVESWIAVNPDSELLPVARANGIAYFEPVPTGGIVSGQSGLLAMSGWTAEAMTAKKPIGLHLFWPSMDLDTRPPEKVTGKNKPKSLEEQAKERREKLRSTMEFFREAAAYVKARDAAAKGNAPAPEPVPAWDAMLPYVSGELPITIHADEIRQIKAAVTWATTNRYKIILAGARDAWKIPDLLASNKVSVIYEHVFTEPARDTDSYDIHFAAPEVLHKAGVEVSFGIGERTFDAPTVRNIPYAAAQAVAFGLPEEEAVKGLTLYPARQAGVADRLGSIEVGKEATLLSADGNILDIRANVKHLWISGKEVSLESRHTRLYDKYKNRPKE